ncbi:MAG: hypothetical protein R2733_02670 [Acidimicrobiales bacterium]
MKDLRDYQAFQQPEIFRTWPEALRRQRWQIGVLLLGFIAGVALFSTSPLAGTLIMVGTAVSLGGTVVAGKYMK